MGKGSSSSNAPQFNPADAQVSAYLPTGTLRYGTVGSGGQFVPRSGGEAYRVVETPGAAQFRQTYEQLGQDIIGRGQGLLGQLTPQVPQMEIDYSRISDIPGPEGFADETARVEQETFERAMGLLNPQFERQQEALQADLAARGIPVGVGNVAASPAARQAIQDLRETQGELTSRAALDAAAQGRAYGGELFRRGLTAREAQLGDQIRDIQLQTGQRQNILNELAQMLQGPQIQAAVPIQDNTFAGQQLSYQGQMDAYAADQARRNAMMGAGFGLLGSLGGGYLAGGF